MSKPFWRRAASLLAAVALLATTAGPAAAVACNPSGTGTVVPYQLRGQHRAQSGVFFNYAGTGVDMPVMPHAASGENSFAYIEMQDERTGAYVRAGIKIVRDSSGMHVYRYYRLVDRYGEVKYNEASEEVSITSVTSFSVDKDSYPTGVLWTMHSSQDSGQPDEFWMAYGLGTFDPNIVYFVTSTNNTDSQWFGEVDQKFTQSNAGYETQYGSGSLNFDFIWWNGPYGSTWPKWSKDANRVARFWDTRCP